MCGVPTKTMFQFEPVQRCHSVLRDIHCCWVPESTVPSTTVSLIQPPLAQPCCWFSTMLPCTCMRRNDTACETAHCIVPLSGVTEKPSADRQNVVVALLLREAASTRTSPMMWTASGEAPKPITCV